MPDRALATVRSSRSAPSCMMTATSPAAKYSPMMSDAISASDTSTSALMSNSVVRPMNASTIMGTPQSKTAIQAGLKGREVGAKKLATSAIADTTRQAISRFVPPHSSMSSRPAISALMMPRGRDGSRCICGVFLVSVVHGLFVLVAGVHRHDRAEHARPCPESVLFHDSLQSST